MPYRAFVSSTFVDLKDHRAHVIGSLRRAGISVDPMEDWTADGEEPKKFSQDRLEGCDLCVLLIAFRRGYVPDGEIRSITQLEYEAAIKLGVDVLPFMLDDDAPWRAKYDERDKDPEIVKWRAELRKRHGVQPFYLDPGSIEMTGTLSRWLSKNNRARQADGPAQEKPVSKSAGPATITWDIDKDGSPYPGLMHFTRKHSRVFFGRDDEIREILYRMGQPEGRFIIVSGDSGVGKSSVVDAGLLPKLEDGGLPTGEPCVAVRMVPGQTSQPFGALMTALGSFAARAGLRPDAIVEALKQSPDTLTEQLRKIVPGGLDGKALVLFLDQMEELFTAQDIEQSNRFLTALYQATQEKALWVLATIRSDQLHFCHRHPQMLQVLRSQGHYPLGRVEPFMMQDMIVKPAKCAGLAILENFARRLVHDMGADAADLPLLAFVLQQLFENRSNHELSERVYVDRLKGVRGAIEQHVKNAEAKIRIEVGAKSDVNLSKIFSALALVKKEEDLPTRRRPLLSAFDAKPRQIVDLLVRERLLRTDGDGESATVSISHEKLFEAWPALREFVEANKKALIDHTLLDTRARKWVNMGRPWFTGTASGREYRDFRRADTTATQMTKEYLSASRRARWLRLSGGAIIGLLLLMIVQAWQSDMSVKHTFLQLRSMVTAIHIEPLMADIKPGSFAMGDVVGDGDRDEQPVHEVRLGEPFKLGKHEVTFDEYERFAIATRRSLPYDGGWGRGRRPVINVSWQDANDYAKWLSEQTGKRYRLPTEAEWEYAARSEGVQQKWSGTSNEQELANFAWYDSNSGARTQEVGQKNANRSGLHDMSGNVWEWVEDCWHGDYRGAPTDGTAWLEANGGNCGLRVLRGGSFVNIPAGLRSSDRVRNFADYSVEYIGFRLAQDVK